MDAVVHKLGCILGGSRSAEIIQSISDGRCFHLQSNSARHRISRVRVLDFRKWHLRSCLRSPEVEKSCISFEEILSESVISCLPYLCKFLPVRFADGDEKNRDVKLKNNWDATYIEEQKFIRKLVGLVAVSFVSIVLSDMFCQKNGTKVEIICLRSFDSMGMSNDP